MGLQGLPASAAILLAQVFACLHLGIACLGQQLGYGISLVVAVFQQQPAAGLQVGFRIPNDLPDVIESIRTRGERGDGFVGECGQVWVAFGDVGWVADDEVKLLACYWGQP